RGVKVLPLVPRVAGSNSARKIKRKISPETLGNFKPQDHGLQPGNLLQDHHKIVDFRELKGFPGGIPLFFLHPLFAFPRSYKMHFFFEKLPSKFRSAA
ncbi:hypothetical protein L9F63_021504, partial [Diploptera punctata]